ncbi:MAG: cytochrome c biogenesis protein ResB [bacterium]
MNDSKKNKTSKENVEIGLFDILLEILRDALNDFYKLLQDMRFAAVVLTLIAIATLIGTALPQTNMIGAKAATQLTGIFGEKAYTTIIKPLGFDNVFKTLWYQFLMVLIVLSVTLCAWARTKTATALSKIRSPQTNPKGVEALKYSGKKICESKDAAHDWIKKYIVKQGFILSNEESNEEIHFFGRKNITSKWMIVIMHYSFVLMLLGAIIGGTFGSDEDAIIQEGKTWRTKDGKATVKLIDYWMEYDEKDLPDELSLFYSGMPSDFKSQVQALDESGNVVQEKVIEVNRKLRHNGYNFYQQNWFFEPIFSIYKNGKKVDRFIVEQNRVFMLSTSGIKFVIPPGMVISGKRIIHDKVGSISEEDVPPSCIIKSSYDEKSSVFSLNDRLQFNVGDDLYEIQFDGMREYTGLQVKRDPGVGIVFLGFFLCVVGGTWGLLLPFGTARAMIRKKSGKWQVLWGQTLPAYNIESENLK